MRGIIFILLILAPLALATPLTILRLRHGAHARFLPGLLAAVAMLAVWSVLLHPLDTVESFDRIGISLTIAVGIYVSVWLAHRKWVRIVCLISIILSGSIACILLYSISDGYRDNTRNPYLALQRSIRNQLATELLLAAENQTFPAGYISAGSPIMTSLPVASRNSIESDLKKWGYSWQVERCWHTPLTGMYRVKRTPVQLWYPGGKVKDVVENLTWRRVETPTP